MKEESRLQQKRGEPSSVSLCVRFAYWACVSKPALYPLTMPSRNPESACMCQDLYQIRLKVSRACYTRTLKRSASMAERLRALTIAQPTVQGSLDSDRRCAQQSYNKSYDKSGGAIYCTVARLHNKSFRHLPFFSPCQLVHLMPHSLGLRELCSP